MVFGKWKVGAAKREVQVVLRKGFRTLQTNLIFRLKLAKHVTVAESF